MKKMIKMGLTVIVLFGASAASSWMIFHQANDETVNEDSSSVIATVEQDESVDEDENQRVAFQPDDISVDTLLKLVSSIKSRESAMTTRQALIDQQQQRVDMALADLEREQEEVQELSLSVDSKFQKVEELIQQINLQPKKVGPAGISGEQNSEVSESTKYAPKQVKKLAEWIQGMQVDQAALTITEFVNDGKVDLVALIMMQIEDRDASKILGALGDHKLIKQLAEAVLDAKANAN